MSWILIAFAIALIFGVIKIEDIKSFGEKMLPKLKKLMDTAASKSAEFKEKLNAESDAPEERKKDSEE